MKLPEHTSRIAEIKEILSWIKALDRLDPDEQKEFIVKKAIDGIMTKSVACQLINTLSLQGA